MKDVNYGIDILDRRVNDYVKNDCADLFSSAFEIDSALVEANDILANSGLSEFKELGYKSWKNSIETRQQNMHILSLYSDNVREELYDGCDYDFYSQISSLRSELKSVKLSHIEFIGDNVDINVDEAHDKLSSMVKGVRRYWFNNPEAETVYLIGLYRVMDDSDIRNTIEEQLKQKLRDSKYLDSELNSLFPYLEMEDFIDDYERNNPEDASKLEKWLDSDKDGNISQIDSIYIKYYAYSADKTYRNIFFDSIDKYKIASTNVSGEAFFRFRDNPATLFVDDRGVYYSAQESFFYDYRGPYISLYHEAGHAADYYLGGDKALFLDVIEAGTLTYTQKIEVPSNAIVPENAVVVENKSDTKIVEMTIEDAIYYDVFYNDNNPHSVMSIANSAVQNRISSGNPEIVANALVNRIDVSILSAEDQRLYRYVVGEMQNGPTGPEYATVTDIVGSVSDNLLVNYSGTVFIHNDEYWADGIHFSSTELWAEWMSYQMTGYDLAIDNTREYLPTACSCIEGYASEIGGQ